MNMVRLFRTDLQFISKLTRSVDHGHKVVRGKEE